MRRFLPMLLIVALGCSDHSPSQISTSPRPEVIDAAESHAAEVGKPSTLSVRDIVLEPTTAINGKLELLMPADFALMGEEMLKLKYPSERRPTLVYTNDSGAINIAINHTENRVPQSELSAAHASIDRMFRNLYPSATWFSSGIVKINGRDWLSLNVRTPALDTEIRNIIVGTSLEGRLLLVSFNVTKEREEAWLEPAEAIIKSLRIND